MKLLTILTLSIFLTACTSRTQYGDCVGLDRQGSNPHLEYRVSTNNVIWAVVFAETVVVPVFVALDQLYCPVGTTDVPVSK